MKGDLVYTIDQMEKPPILFQYREIARVLKDQILRGDYQKTGKLPSERLLVERFGVQRNTVRQALRVLEHEGQIVTEGKRGSFVRPTPSAANGRTFLVNIHGGHSPNLNRLRAGFGQACQRVGFKVEAVDSHPRHGAALDPIPEAATLSNETAGAMIWPQTPTNAAALLRLNMLVPVVLVDRRVMGLSLDCVRFDDYTGARGLCEHLIAEGHRKIAFIGDEVFAETVQARWRGYAAALESNDIPIDNRLTQFFNGLDAPFFGMAMRHILGFGADAPTAVMCSNDVVALYLLRFLHDEGIRVPDDIAVTGYGNAMPDYGHALGLTTVDQPFFELGEAAANILMERIGQSTADRLRSTHDIIIPVQPVIRGSSSSNR